MVALSNKITIEVDPEGLEVMRRLNDSLGRFLEQSEPVASSYNARELTEETWNDGHPHQPAVIGVLPFSHSVGLTASYENRDGGQVDLSAATAEGLDDLIDGLIYARETVWGPR